MIVKETRLLAVGFGLTFVKRLWNGLIDGLDLIVKGDLVNDQYLVVKSGLKRNRVGIVKAAV